MGSITTESLYDVDVHLNYCTTNRLVQRCAFNSKISSSSRMEISRGGRLKRDGDGLETAQWYNKLPFKTNRACFVQKPARETCLQDFRRDSPLLAFDPRPRIRSRNKYSCSPLGWPLNYTVSSAGKISLSLSLPSPCFFLFPLI